MPWTGERALRAAMRRSLGLVLGRRLPVVSGELRVLGPAANVSIFRDAVGIPHIHGESEHDVFFGLGFCHAQDRGTQLELSLRTVRGTLSELVGRDGIAVDRLSRRIGFRRAAAQQLENMRADVRAQIEAYVTGINQGFARGTSGRAHGLALLGAEPSQWEAADAQALSVLLCFALAANWDVELMRYEMLRRDGAEALLALDAPYPGDMPSAKSPLLPSGHAGLELSRDLDALRALFPLAGASNAWAIAGSKTRSGRPLLGADPHLPPEVPVHWYLAHLATPEMRVSGACFVGIPGIGIGHNEHCAWAVTAAHADNTDFFLEQVGEDGHSVRDGDRYVSCEVRREVIAVKGAAPIHEDVLETPRGPIVGAALGGPREELSISATWLSSRPYTGLYRAHACRGRAEFHRLFEQASTSSVNVVYADREGGIMWRLGVEVPIRAAGHGTLPRPGWTGDAGFRGVVPFEDMPFVEDPPEGFVASANNAPEASGAPGRPFLGIDFLDGYRQQVIVEALSGRADFTLEDMQALQRDVRSIPWEQVRSKLLSLEPTEIDALVAKNLLVSWDGQMDADSVAASVWALFSAKMMTRVVRAKAPHTAGRALGAGFHEALPHNTMITRRLSHLCRLLLEQPEGFLREGWPRACERALADAVSTLRSRCGDDLEAWAWGRARPLRLSHPLGKAVPALDLALGAGPVAFAGDASTVHQGTLDLIEPLKSPLAAPTLRVAIDVGAWENSRFALIAGQSENPLSPHHFDQFEAWQRGGFAISWTREAAQRNAKHTLVLAPA